MLNKTRRRIAERPLTIALTAGLFIVSILLAWLLPAFDWIIKAVITAVLVSFFVTIVATNKKWLREIIIGVSIVSICFLVALALWFPTQTWAEIIANPTIIALWTILVKGFASVLLIVLVGLIALYTKSGFEPKRTSLDEIALVFLAILCAGWAITLPNRLVAGVLYVAVLLFAVFAMIVIRFNYRIMVTGVMAALSCIAAAIAVWSPLLTFSESIWYASLVYASCAIFTLVTTAIMGIAIPALYIKVARLFKKDASPFSHETEDMLARNALRIGFIATTLAAINLIFHALPSSLFV